MKKKNPFKGLIHNLLPPKTRTEIAGQMLFPLLRSIRRQEPINCMLLVVELLEILSSTLLQHRHRCIYILLFMPTKSNWDTWNFLDNSSWLKTIYACRVCCLLMHIRGTYSNGIYTASCKTEKTRPKTNLLHSLSRSQGKSTSAAAVIFASVCRWTREAGPALISGLKSYQRRAGRICSYRGRTSTGKGENPGNQWAWKQIWILHQLVGMHRIPSSTPNK